MRTLVTNTSGATKHFCFLPPHGLTLANGETTTVDGDLRTVLASGRGRYSGSRDVAALDAAVAAGRVSETQLPDPSSSSSSSSVGCVGRLDFSAFLPPGRCRAAC
jgi:hypothetical protein